MNNNWGYCQTDKDFKPAPMVIQKLVECVSKGGNLLLNVGPDAKGNIPPESLAILDTVGNWMQKNGASVYGCGIAGIPKPEYGRITRKEKTIYFHVTENQVGFIPLHGVTREQVKKVRLLSTGAELKIANGWITDNYPDKVFVSFGASPLLPDPADTVIEVELV
jgi:alpha-L-fucosidase